MTNENTDSPADEIQKNLSAIRNRIILACERFHRDPNDVSLLAVSKTKPLSMVESALAVGQVDFGENYLQDALAKIESLSAVGHQQKSNWKPPSWHYIGAIQSNKTRQIAEHFDWVHTVSSFKVAQRLSNQRPEQLAPLNVLLQINIDAESTKSGITPDQLSELISAILPLSGIRLRGLMTIPSPSGDIEQQRQPFRALNELLQQSTAEFGDDLRSFDQLSMGMTADLEAAVAEGATWLRIGTAIFGERN